MCGIAGGFFFNPNETSIPESAWQRALDTLSKRGPDNANIYHSKLCTLVHTRLSIIDTSTAANQPLTCNQNRYTIVFNGEIYNFKALRQELSQLGYTFKSQSDTEVVLYAYKAWGAAMLHKLNGFFALAIYDKHTQNLFIARDRIGIKPLLVYADANKILFASELKALMALSIPKKIDLAAVEMYLQLSYLPPPYAILENVYQLQPGTFLQVSLKKASQASPPINSKFTTTHCLVLPNHQHIKQCRYYHIGQTNATNPLNKHINNNFEGAAKHLRHLLSNAVKKRLVADVPLGSFLSGGIDSSIVAALAQQSSTKAIHTYSIGFPQHPQFDETPYAKAVAQSIGSKHQVFNITHNDLLAHINEVLAYIDEPFADSSALAVYMLSKKTKQQVSVALSGDGGDELFAGYRKHKAWYSLANNSILTQTLQAAHPILNKLPLPNARSGFIANRMRQILRLTEGASLQPKDRYWRWASFTPPVQAALLMRKRNATNLNNRKTELLHLFNSNSSLTTSLLTDCQMVLPGDMLHKVDSMSMANSLEVRTPFLDHNIVEFAFSLPENYKITKQGINTWQQKRILQEAFADLIPPKIFTRSKQGFEVPLQHWFTNQLHQKITNDWLCKENIEKQGIFNFSIIEKLLEQLHSPKAGDAVHTIWALIVFQNWYDTYIN